MSFKSIAFILSCCFVFLGCQKRKDSNLSRENKPEPISIEDHKGPEGLNKEQELKSDKKPDAISLEAVESKDELEKSVKKVIAENQRAQEKDAKKPRINKETPKKEVKTKEEVAVKRVVTAPKIVFTEPIFNFDTITEGDVIDHVFTFKNAGNKELNLAKVVPGCGCTLPTYPFIGIAPGESNEIKVRYNSVSKNGPQKSVIEVYSDDPNQEIYEIALVGYVKGK